LKDLFEFYGEYYDLLYEDKDTLRESTYVDFLLKEYGTKIKKILEFGVGTGRHAKKLIDLGYVVHGIERSEKMSKKLNKIINLKYEVGDIETINLKNKFDAILSLFHVMSYQITNKKVENIFNNANRHLKKGGLFIFDIWYTPAVKKIKPSVRVKRFNNEDFKITRIAEPKEYPELNRIDVCYDFFVEIKNDKKFHKFNEIHPMRHFSISEIEFFASNNGFRCINVEEWLTKKKPSQNTWGVCFVLEKV